MGFNPTISWDGIIALCAFVFAVVGVLIRMGRIEEKVNIMFSWFQEVIKPSTGHDRTKKFFGVDE